MPEVADDNIVPVVSTDDEEVSLNVEDQAFVEEDALVGELPKVVDKVPVVVEAFVEGDVVDVEAPEQVTTHFKLFFKFALFVFNIDLELN